MALGGTAYPPDPVFDTASEALVWSTLRDQLRDGDVMLHGIRFSDPRSGDVEADILLLLPDLGAVVVEVKGGQVSYADGRWLSSYGGVSRRIHPVEQARRAKHAVRRFLDRQREWPFGYLRTEWMVAFPYTAVDGDLGPEGRRDLILGRDDLDSAMERIVALMSQPATDSPVPSEPWVDRALALLRAGDPPASHGNVDGHRGGVRRDRGARQRWWVIASAAALVAAGTVTAGVVWARSGPQHPRDAVPVSTSSATSAPCHPAYSPCVDPIADADCRDIGRRVTVIDPAVDPLDLDADADGIGCESYPP